MFSYIIKKLLELVSVLLGAVIFIFLIFHLFAEPGALMNGQYVTTSRAEALMENTGAKDPLHEQLGRFIWQLTHGDLGRSLATGSPVTSELLARFPATIELFLVAMLIASLAGILMGVIAAVKQRSIFDYTSAVATLLGMSVPVYWLGLMLIVLFSVCLGWLPESGRIGAGLEPAQITGFFLVDSLLAGKWEAFASTLGHLALPAAALASYSMAIIARMTRSAMVDVYKQDYISTARAKGLGEHEVLFRQVLPNVIIRMIVVTGLQAGPLLVGAVLIETVFDRPGIGRLLVDSVMAADYPLVQGCLFFMVALILIMKLIMDLLHALLEPGTRYF